MSGDGKKPFEVGDWGFHNRVITSIKKDEKELIPYDRPDYKFGYSDPRDFFPEAIVRVLDEML